MIIRGNHHDAWVNGADDPVSGMVVVLEEARSLGELMKQGWRPKRTLIYCAWDGEEPGLLGSTEWVEEHDSELREHAVMYLNSDSSARGYLGISGSHTLERAVIRSSATFRTGKHISVWQRSYLRRVGRAVNAETGRNFAIATTFASARWAMAPTTLRFSIIPACCAEHGDSRRK